jgi:hypothetical protein
MQQEVAFYVNAKMLKKPVVPATLVDGTILRKIRADLVQQ